MNRDQLLDVLEKFQVPVVVKDTACCGTAALMQRGARAIGLFPRGAGSTLNMLWVNPYLQELVGGGLEDWIGKGAGSVGGDRLWISPERNFYYLKPQAFEDWSAPTEMDPGNYIEKRMSADSVRYENRFSLRDRLQNVTLENILMSRTLTPIAAPPAEQDILKDTEGVGYVAIDSVECLEIVVKEGQPAPRICPWGLTQVVIPGNDRSGTVIVPTARRAAPIHYFGPLGEDRVRVFDDHVTFRIDALKIAKLGVRPEDLAPEGPVRIAYLLPAPVPPENPSRQSDEWVLLVRESSDVARTSADAIDPAKADPDGPRGVVQSYNCGPGDDAGAEYPMFGEIELQYLPVRHVEGGLWRSEVRSRLMAFQGERETIFSLAKSILGISSINTF